MKAEEISTLVTVTSILTFIGSLYSLKYVFVVVGISGIILSLVGGDNE